MHATAPPVLSWKQAALDTAERTVSMTTLSSSIPHLITKTGATAWRAFQTAPGAFLSASSGHSYAGGASHFIGSSVLSLAVPWLSLNVSSERYTIGAKPGVEPRPRGSPWLKKSLLGLVILSAARDLGGEGGAVLLGATGIGLAKYVRSESAFLRLVAQNAPWILMEVGRTGAPMLSHHWMRQQRIKTMQSQAMALGTEEDVARAWTQMAFVGGHLSQDLGNVPFYGNNAGFRLLAPIGRFASHQTLTLGEQIDRGYDLFSLETFAPKDGAVLSSHSTVWSYGPIENALAQISGGLARNPDALAIIKISPQGSESVPSLDSAFSASGILKYMPQGYDIPPANLSKLELKQSGIRVIVVGDEIPQTTFEANSVADLLPSGQKTSTYYRSPSFAPQPRLLNLFTTWGYEPWSEYVNLYLPQILEAHQAQSLKTGIPINLVLANDVETSNLLEFKRLYNAPRK